jgi:glycosyltransferase involved in cell wall biosynthesis
MPVPTFSIITVSYNEERTIASTLRSILDQCWDLKELIVIDGRSTDGTVDAVAPFRGNLAHFVSEPDAGLYDAMNKGLARATGDYVCFMNAGDRFFAPDVLARMAEASGDGASLLFGRALVTSVEGCHLSPPGGRSIETWLGRGFPAHQATFYPRRFARDARYDLALGSAADTDYTLRAIAAATYRFVDVVVCEFTLGGISNRFASLGEALAIARQRSRVLGRHPNAFRIDFIPKYVAGPIVGWALRAMFGASSLTRLRHRLDSHRT